MRVGQLDQAEFVARVDLEVLGELREVRCGDREGRQQLGVHVPLPGGVLRVHHEPVAAEQLGEPRAIERPARAGAAADARDAARELAVGVSQALCVAQRRVGVGEQQVAGGRRLRGLQVRVVRGRRGAQLARLRRERSGAFGERSRELGGSTPRARAQGHAEGLAARPPRAQPARGRGADAAHELGLA